MTLKAAIVLTTFVLSCSLHPATAQGNLVVNGDFNDGTAGWTLTNVYGSGYESTRGNPPGDFLLDGPSSPSSANQTITSLTPGTIYVVSGDYREVGGKNFTDYTFGVALDGNYVFKMGNPGNINWQSFSFGYTATSSSTLLSLSAQLNGSDFVYAIDNISIIATPEPSSLCLIGIGGIMSAILFRNRRKC
jgi:hypothetical protein